MRVHTSAAPYRKDEAELRTYSREALGMAPPANQRRSLGFDLLEVKELLGLGSLPLFSK